MKILRGIFYVEILINLITAGISFFNPSMYASLFTNASVPSLILEMLRWYGVLLVVFIYLEARALLSKRDELLSLVLEGFLVGDILQMVAIVIFFNAGGGWSTNMIVTIAITILLAASRIIWLVRHYSPAGQASGQSSPHASLAPAHLDQE